ncbi:hypothetical protein F443_00666 [Phytophthora nicotianae P1569]|uniref:Uncharacterized protein n=1 Tax=Phytophthora nicotianae P1569 TaxID=1317065 RepID=V9FZU0_PHYNI|nr:hypothetical protein F443_00666 [Phytophthora nicotianae P1569]
MVIHQPVVGVEGAQLRDKNGSGYFFGSLAKVIVEENMDATRVFNVDETALESSRKTTRVVAREGSKMFGTLILLHAFFSLL